MDLIFLWTSLMKGNDTKGVSLSGKYDVELNLDDDDNYLVISDRFDCERTFWGDENQDCFAIVGENGAGKTKLVNEIMHAVQEGRWGFPNKDDYFIIFEDIESYNLYYICTKHFDDIKINNKVKRNIEKIVDSEELLNKFPIAYFHNALGENDYNARNRCTYDFSLGYLIKNYREKTYQMKYDDLNRDAVVNYFRNEEFRIAAFIYDYTLKDDVKIDFPVPQKIYIEIADASYNEQYVLGRAKGLRVNRGEEEELSEQIEQFRLGVDNIKKVYGIDWTSYVIRNLIYNLFKELCIPATVPTKITYEHEVFFTACEFLNKENKLCNMDIYDCLYTIIKKLREDMNLESVVLDKTERFANWLKENKKRINEFEVKRYSQIIVPVNKESEPFMQELIRLYSDVMFEFPFLSLSFGVSTGEFYFLSIFSNLYSIIKPRHNAINAYDVKRMDIDDKSILLIFDEVDLGLHPKWQRMFMKWVLDFCKEMYKNIFIKIIITTHSPMLLSDFPQDRVLYLEKSEGRTIYKKKENIKTFGRNIHSLFLDSFFLNDEGIMGAFAEERINGIVNEILKDNVADNVRLEYKNIINYIGEDLIKQKINFLLECRNKARVEKMDDKEESIMKDTLNKLNLQKSNLEQMINNIKELLYG